MKKLILLLVAVLAVVMSGRVTPKGGAQTPRKVFNVKDYGAVGDNSTNDVVAFRAARAAANVAGGLFVIPDGTYKLLVGDPATDPNYTSVLVDKSILNFTANNTEVYIAPNATVNVVSSYIYQNTAGATTANTQSLFYVGDGSSLITNFAIRGTGTFTFALTSPASYTTVDNGKNGFYFLNAKTWKMVLEDFTIDGFPNGGTLIGQTISSEELMNGTITNVKMTDWGSAGHDNGFYFWGGTLWDNCYFKTTRKSSHPLYTGSDKPNVTIRRCYFEGVDNIATPLTNKYAIQVYSVSGTVMHGIEIASNTFKNCIHPIIIGKDDGVTYATSIRITNNDFIGQYSGGKSDQAITISRWRDFVISDNHFDNFEYAMSGFPPEHGTISNNTFNACKYGVDIQSDNSSNSLLIANNNFRGIPASGIGVRAGCKNCNIVNNLVDVGSNTGVVAFRFGIDGTPTDVVYQNNIVMGAGNATSVSAWKSDRASVRIRILNNIVNLTTSGRIIDLTANCTDCLMDGGSYLTAGSGDAGAFNLADTLTGTFILRNFQLTCGNLYWGLADTIPEGLQVTYGSIASSAGAKRPKGLTLNGNYEFIAASGSSATPNAGLYNEFRYTATGNFTVNNPTNPADGAEIRLHLIEDATGGRTWTFGAAFTALPGSCTLSTTANAKNVLNARYNSVDSKWYWQSCASGQ